jgi:hypothetical protein
MAQHLRCIWVRMQLLPLAFTELSMTWGQDFGTLQFYTYALIVTTEITLLLVIRYQFKFNIHIDSYVIHLNRNIDIDI